MNASDASSLSVRRYFLAKVLLLLCVPLLVWQALPGGQIAMSQAVFLSAHSLLEMASIVISGLVFFIAFGTREAERSRRVVVLGCFFLATALFDAVHTLSYPGMPDIVSPNSADKMIWFWLAGRFCVGLGLLWYVLSDPDRQVHYRQRWALLGWTLAAVAVVFYVVFAHEHQLPAMFVPGQGLTPLKIGLEWLLCGLYLWVAVLFWRGRHNASLEYDARTLFYAMLLMAAGELFFTVYTQVSSTANVLGHVYKVIAYAYLFQAIFAAAVRAPFVRIQQLNAELARSHAALEQRVAERTAELSQARDESERANLAKTEFLSRMSHELRTPLNAILGFGQMLKMDVRDTHQAENVQEILKAGQHLLTQVNEVLDLARIDSGRIELSLEPVGVAATIADCLAQLKPLAEQRGLAMHAAIDATLAVQADPVRLKQVLLNLLSNAIKYNRDGGTIDLTAAIADGRLRIAVRDTGRGIEAEKLARLFKPFERLESSYDGIEGTGIGLALVKRLVEAMGGEVGVESEVDQGSTFWFALPAATLPDQPETTTPGVSAGGTATATDVARQSQHRVLYVEDNPANLRLVRKMLATRPEFTLLEAPDAELGLAIALREQPGLILLDINLPGMDGFAALGQLKAWPETADIPVVAITANAMPRDIERGRAAGFADYLTKPLDVKQFLATVQRCLGGNKA